MSVLRYSIEIRFKSHKKVRYLFLLFSGANAVLGESKVQLQINTYWHPSYGYIKEEILLMAAVDIPPA